jgi:hypothetical protein
MDQLVADFISRMGLALTLAILVAVKAGHHQMNSLNMEQKITDLAIGVIKENIVNQLEILFRVYRDTTGDVNLPTGVNLQEVAERLFFIDESVQWLNQLYLDLVKRAISIYLEKEALKSSQRRRRMSSLAAAVYLSPKPYVR